MLASLDKSELARQIQYLKAENEILRAKLPKRVTVTPTERRRLLRLGKAVGSALKHLVTIVTYRTFLCWVAGNKAGSPASGGVCGRRTNSARLSSAYPAQRHSVIITAAIAWTRQGERKPDE